MYARQTDHILSQVINLHRFSHIKYKQLTVLCHCSTLQYQLGCLRNCHEITDDSLISNSDRSAVCNLSSEQRNNRTCTSQYVSKSGCTALHFSMGTCTLHDHLAHTLSCTHYVCRIYRLISRNHHKTFCPIFFTQFHQISRSKYIVIDCFHAVILHQRHMLMSSRIDDDLRMMFFKHFFQCFLVSDRADLNLQIQSTAISNF